MIEKWVSGGNYHQNKMVFDEKYGFLDKSGNVYTGCNIENASYGMTNCGERTAIFKAVSEGEVAFEKIAVVGGRDEPNEMVSPCGVCRQVMAEFCDESFVVLLFGSET